jgi:hypothetical protein
MFCETQDKKILKESLLRKDYRERMIYGLSLNGETKDEWSLYNSLVSELRKIGDDNHICLLYTSDAADD